MTKSKNTKRALLMSILSMLLCVSMLVSTTFAWFTDSVTSGKNKIVAGNLDVELEYCLDPSAEEPVWNFVEGAEDFFDAIKLWEPGTTGVVYFRLSNLGTLALKYKLAMSYTDTVIGKNADGGDIKLSEVLEFGIVEGQEETFASREEAVAAVTGAKKINAGYTDEKSMSVTEDKTYFALVVYMPATTGNEANYRGEAIPQIDLGVSLLATQDTVESDSFGNDYDGNIVLAASTLQKLLADGGNVSVADSMELPNKNTLESITEIKKATVLNLQESVLTFRNDIMPGDAYNNYAAVYVSDDLTVNAGDKGGVDSDFYGFDLASSENNESPTLTINGGTYKAGSVVNVGQGTVYINGGLFDGRSVYGEGVNATFLLNCIDRYYKSGEAKIIVTGGTFINFDPSNNAAEGQGTNFVAKGYHVTSEVKGVDTYYTVVED